MAASPISSLLCIRHTPGALSLSGFGCRRKICGPSRVSTKFVARNSSFPVSDRAVAALSFTLPLMNSLQYGRFMFGRFPALSALLSPIMPVLSAYRSFPGGSFLAFFGLYLGVVRNPVFSPYARYNVMQALSIDILLAIPFLLTRIISPERSSLPGNLILWAHSAVFVFSLVCFMYGFLFSLLGKTPYIPFVADAAAGQIR